MQIGAAETKAEQIVVMALEQGCCVFSYSMFGLRNLVSSTSTPLIVSPDSYCYPDECTGCDPAYCDAVVSRLIQ